MTDLDTSEMELAEERLRERILQAQLDSLFVNAPVGFAFIDRDYHFTAVNQTLADIHNVPVEEHGNHSVTTLLHFGYKIQPIIREVFESGKATDVLEVTGEISARPGEEKTFLATFFPVYLDDEVVQVGVVVIDITDRKEIEAELAASDSQLQAAMRTVPLVLYRSDLDMRYTWVSSYHPQWAEEGILGKADGDLMGAEDSEKLIRFKQRTIDTELVQREAFVLDTEFGRQVWDITLRPHFENGQIAGVMGVALDITDQKAVESQMQLREEQLRMAVELANLGVWEFVFADGEFRLDDRARAIIGVGPSQTVDKSYVLSITHPDDVATVAQHFPDFQALTEQGSALEARIVKPDGSVRWIFANGRVQLAEDGETPELVTGVVMDITGQKEIEHTLRRGEEHLRDVLDNLFTFVGVLTPDGIVEAVNRPALQASSHTLEDVVGVHFADTYWWSYSEEVRSTLIESLQRAAAGEYVRYDTRIRIADDTFIVIDFMLAPIIDGSGTVTHLIPSGLDITDRKRAEEETRENEMRFRTMFEQAAVGVAQIGLDGRYWRVNDKLCQILGYTPEEFLNFTFLDITDPRDKHAGHESRSSMLDGKVPMTSAEKRYIAKDGKSIWVNVSASLMRNPETNEPQSFISVIEDISDRKQAEAELQRLNQTLEQRVLDRTAELEKSNQELDQFAYIASHDLKAPLRAIDSLASWVIEDVGDSIPEASLKHLHKLRSRADRMDGLLNDLLEYSRAGREQDKIRELDLTEVVESVADLAQSNAADGDFRVNVQPNMPIFWGEEVPLRTVLRNLIGNAIKHHNRPDGQVFVSAEHHNDEFVRICVADDGPGIEAQFQERIFEIFQTLQPRDKREGSGVGLAVVKKIVEARKGWVEVTSAPEQGSRFCFTWPKMEAVVKEDDNG